MGERRVVVIKNTDILFVRCFGELSAPFEKANLPGKMFCLLYNVERRINEKHS